MEMQNMEIKNYFCLLNDNIVYKVLFFMLWFVWLCLYVIMFICTYVYKYI
jgi:hypothetical protein